MSNRHRLNNILLKPILGNIPELRYQSTILSKTLFDAFEFQAFFGQGTGFIECEYFDFSTKCDSLSIKTNFSIYTGREGLQINT